MLTGFYHPARFAGVPWFPRSEPTAEYLAGLPVGTVTGVPIKPGEDYTYEPGSNAWVHNPPAITVDQVRTEAARRILAVCPEWKQRNLTARAAELAMKGSANWATDEQAEVAAGQAIWDQIKAIRTASNALEPMDPIPADYADDSHWP
ncbi:MAG: hypothetical protein RIE06_31290 [Roseibium album]|uniref:hypothetical protein n=1 Tax=Roseibium album TaxID=311410 RepID=UPI0032EB87E4